MNIGVDARVLEKNTTGIGRILSGILDNIPNIDNTISFILFTNIPINIEYKKCTNVSTNNSKYLSKVMAPFWIDYVLPKHIKKYKIDLFFAPNFFLPSILKKKNIKSIVVIHDVINKAFPEFQPFFYRKYLDFSVKRSVKTSDLILADSECSKRDIIRYYQVSPEKIEVVYPFLSEIFKHRVLDNVISKRIRDKYGLPKEFILYVGVIEKRKNIQAFINISLELQKRKISIPIILVGRKGFGAISILNQIKECAKIKYIDFIDDADLPFLYNLAKIFVFPSLYEGFGFPPLEAMKSGLPIVTSNSGSLPEVVGETIPLFQPFDINGMADEIESLLSDHVYYQLSQEKCIIQANKFSSKSSTEKILQAFQKVIKD